VGAGATGEVLGVWSDVQFLVPVQQMTLTVQAAMV
jgi:hypothetical protein